jgi:hypothetical protein
MRSSPKGDRAYRSEHVDLLAMPGPLKVPVKLVLLGPDPTDEDLDWFLDEVRKPLTSRSDGAPSAVTAREADAAAGGRQRGSTASLDGSEPRMRKRRPRRSDRRLGGVTCA